MAKRGRPRGLNINPVAVEDFLSVRCMSKKELCDLAGITPGHFADMLRRQKGVSPTVLRDMAMALRCSPETLAPELTNQFVSVRPGDDFPVLAADVA